MQGRTKTAEKEAKQYQKGQVFERGQPKQQTVKESFDGMGAAAEMGKRRKKRSAYKADERIRL